MNLFFITGNKNKYDEIKSILPNVQQIDIDLPEIQSLDPKEVIAKKIEFAFAHKKGEFIVEDSSLMIDGMSGLPGTMTKWFLKSVGNEGIVKMANVFGSQARAVVLVGYAKKPDEIEYFEGIIEGEIVEPRGNMGFGWDPIFLPKGYSQTFGEMDFETKNSLSMRKMAVEKLKDFLN